MWFKSREETNYQHIENGMTWREFEKFCENLIYESVNKNKWRIEIQRKKTYKDGTAIMDCHIAERRRGGRSFVIDFKHFTTSRLNKHEIDSVLEYKRKCRASGAILMISSESNEWKSFRSHAEKKGVIIYNVNIDKKNYILKKIESYFNNIERHLK